MSLVKKDERQEALVRKARDSYRPLKRPAVVLDEDEYVDGLSEVIKRQFFPDLVESEEHDHLAHQSAQGRPSASTPRLQSDHAGSSVDGENDAPSDMARTNAAEASRRDSKVMSLREYQARYTSEDNASFLSLLDRQNLQRREKHAWHYTGNIIYSENTERHQKRLVDQQAAQVKAIGWTDDRRGVDGWQGTATNALMFNPDAEDSLQGTQRETQVSLRNTRLPDMSSSSTPAPSHGVDEGVDDEDEEEPMVNGYGFVDEPDTPASDSRHSNPFPERERVVPDTPNPFKIAETSNRDRLHDSLLAKSRPVSTPRPNSVVRRAVATPKFKSSPVLSPAAHRLLAGKATGLRERLKTPARSNLR